MTRGGVVMWVVICSGGCDQGWGCDIQARGGVVICDRVDAPAGYLCVLV